MRDTRSLLLLLVSLLLVVVSFVLIWTWGYSYYNRKDEPKAVVATDTNAIREQLRDSLQRAYTATLKELDLQLDSTLSNSDSLRSQLDVKLAEFYRLREEISNLLKNRNSNNNYAVAKQKIGELQTKVDDLRDKNQDVESENRKLSTVIEQMKTEPAIPVGTTKTGTQSRPGATYNNLSQPFTASDLRLSAVMNEDEHEVETNIAEKAEKLNGSFNVMNYNSQQTNAEMMVVVIKPDGRVLKTSWDSGTFNTAEGKKIFSYKFNFTYSRGESKRLLFSLKSGSLVKGNYTMEVYHNGLLIGRMVKTLS